VYQQKKKAQAVRGIHIVVEIYRTYDTVRLYYLQCVNSVTMAVRKMMMMIFNSILYYLCAEPTAARPITDSAQCKEK
jgi:hypothetical protein